MRINVLLVLILLLIVIITLVILKKQKSVIMLVLIALGIIIVITSICVFNAPFRDNLSIILKPTVKHTYIVDNKAYHLPLPSNTTLKYRTSDETAVYFTKTELDEIITLYKNISDDDTFIESKDNNKVILSFSYNHYNFCVSVEMYGKLRKVFVDMIS